LVVFQPIQDKQEKEVKPLLHPIIKQEETFNYKVLERKALAVCGLGNKNRYLF